MMCVSHSKRKQRRRVLVFVKREMGAAQEKQRSPQEEESMSTRIKKRPSSPRTRTATPPGAGPHGKGPSPAWRAMGFPAPGTAAGRWERKSRRPPACSCGRAGAPGPAFPPQNPPALASRSESLAPQETLARRGRDRPQHPGAAERWTFAPGTVARPPLAAWLARYPPRHSPPLAAACFSHPPPTAASSSSTGAGTRWRIPMTIAPPKKQNKGRAGRPRGRPAWGDVR